MGNSTVAEDLAFDMLGQSGVAVIWDLQLAAAAAKRHGKVELAAGLMELADVAERIWLARQSAKRNVGPKAA